MKINIHNIIGSDVSDVKNVWIMATKTTTGPTPVVVYFCVDINDIKQENFYDIDDTEIEGAINLKLKYVMEIDGHKHTKFKNIETKPITINSNEFPARILSTETINTDIKFPQKIETNKFKIVSSKLKDNFIYTLNRAFICIKNRIKPSKDNVVVPTGYARDLIKTNTNSNYPNTELGKQKVIKKLNKKTKNGLTLNCNNFGDRNLIYYSVAGTKDWVDLLSISLKSVVEHSILNLDVLIITTSKLKEEILKLKEVEILNIDFFIVAEPIDGVEASMNKLLIYKYKNIKNYNKVLFLDCDTKIVKSLSNVFDMYLDPKKFYTAWSASHVKRFMYNAFKQPYHGIGLFTEDDIKNAELNEQRPFNAGQFLFVATHQMLRHIENVHWLAKEWPAEYFFEQAFLVHYMCINNLTESNSLDKMVNLYSIDAVDPSDISTKEPDDKNIVIYHFIGKSTNIQFKLNFINNFNHANI